jgi:hypothetical protein
MLRAGGTSVARCLAERSRPDNAEILVEPLDNPTFGAVKRVEEARMVCSAPAPAKNMSKLSDYLQQQKIDPRRLLVASHDIEQLRPEDRSVRLAKKRLKGGDETAKEAAEKERRSGRPVSQPTLNRALGGAALSPAAKSRILRAVNAVLTQKKKSEVALRDLF